MGKANILHFGNKVNYYEGVVVELKDEFVAIDVKGRLGYFEVPESHIITASPLMVGQTVGWKMSFIEQLAAGADSDYTPGVQNEDMTFYMEGTVSMVEDCAITMEAKCNQGHYKTPMRMLLSDVAFENGQTVGWNMSRIVQLGPEVNDKYVSNIQNRERRAKEISSRNN